MPRHRNPSPQQLGLPFDEYAYVDWVRGGLLADHEFVLIWADGDAGYELRYAAGYEAARFTRGAFELYTDVRRNRTPHVWRAAWYVDFGFDDRGQPALDAKELRKLRAADVIVLQQMWPRLIELFAT